jgi:hypothetical protein
LNTPLLRSMALPIALPSAFLFFVVTMARVAITDLTGQFESGNLASPLRFGLAQAVLQRGGLRIEFAQWLQSEAFFDRLEN